MATLISGIQMPGTVSVLSWIALLGVLYPIGQAVYYLFFHPLRKYPGPKLAACTRLVELYWSFAGELHLWFKEMHDQYGDVVRVGPNYLVYRTPGAWKEIYGHRHQAKTSMKSPEFNFHPPAGPTIFNEDDESNSKIRRPLSHGFSDKTLMDQEPLVQHYVDLFLERLHEMVAADNGPVEMTRWYNYTTFDIIGDLSFGEPFDCLRDKRYHPWVSIIFDVAVKTFAYGRAFMMYPYISWLIGIMLPRDLYRKRVELLEVSKEKVDRRLETQTGRPDYITYLTRDKNERRFTKEELYANADILVIAGSETTATLLSGFTFYLLKSPPSYKALVEEIRGNFQRQEDITFQSVAKLQYLNAALEEGLRMYPPVPAVPIPRLVLNGGAIIEGQFVPGGTSVANTFYSSFRSRYNFTEPDSFLPDRWIDTKNPRFTSDARDVVQPFGYGPRSCIGKSLADKEMRVIAAKLLWAFDLSLQEESSSWDDQKSCFIWQKNPLMVKLTPVHR